MSKLILFIAKIEWNIIIIACLTLGLAPFLPPHIFEKVSMLLEGNLRKPLDWFDLLLHGMPWLILIAKTVITAKKRGV